MSVKPTHINFIDDENDKQNISSKDYEKIFFNNWQLNIKENDDHDNDTRDNSDDSNISRCRHFKLKLLNVLKSLTKSEVETQLENFQSSMKYCFVSGQCLGLFPIMSITERDVQRQYNIFSWRYLLCLIILLGQIMATALSFYRMLTTRFSLATCGVFLFFIMHLITNVQFIRFSTKWHYVMEPVAKSKLDEYVDPYEKIKCNLATILLLTFSFIEHVLFIMYPFVKLRKCCLDHPDLLKRLAVNLYPWIFTVVPYSIGTFIAVEILTVIITMTWTYFHVFIICISLFLASILERLNKKIISRENQLLPASYWRAIREDYNRAIQLVRYFDDSINGIVFVTFGGNLFILCSRLYDVLGYGYEDFLSNLFSAVFFIIRAFSVSLAAAKIHSAYLVVAPLLYSVPRSSVCTEIQRFLNQIHGTTVALTGLNFFYVTKELVLSMIGTVVTYELVLLQFKRDD